MDKISIVVPTYNVEKYISKCLDSLVNQDYENYDVLVVNDGSPFNEQIIIDKYVAKYPNIIKSIKKENGGYGSALELAFKESDADYILVCDPDDYLDVKAVSTLYRYMQETGADLVVGAKNLVYSDNDEIKYDQSFNGEFGILEDHKIYTKVTKEFEALYFLEPSPHAKLYKRSIVSQIKFPHKVSYTDNLLYFYTLNNVEKVTYCKEPLSYYLINREGNTRTDLKPNIIDAWVTVFKSIMEQVKNAEDIFYYRMFESFYSIYYKVDLINADEKVKLEKYNLIYSFLKTLIPYKGAILNKNQEYQHDTNVVIKQKAHLLDEKLSRKTYDNLVDKRLHGSLKQAIKGYVLNNAWLSKIYDKYHFYAKYIRTRNDEKLILNPQVSCEVLLEEGTNFFGYYDKPCFYKGKYLIHRVNSNSLNLNQEVDILVNGKVVSHTNTWNWQQGSMASWVDGEHIIHNFFDGEQFKAKIVNIKDCSYKIIDFPIYSLSKNKEFALSLNFSRLAKLRPDYGYFNKPYQKLPDDTKDGIYFVDLKNNTHKLFISIDEIKKFKPTQNMAKAVHKVNHIDISPNNDKAIFLHRWYVGKTKYTRLLCLDLASKKLTLLANNKMVSHMAWVNNDLVFGYLKGNNNRDGYFFIDMKGNQTMFDHPQLVDDGHPTVYDDRYIVTDTYPDYTCKSKLFLIDVLEHNVINLGQFYSGIRYQGTKRDDLHPRFDYQDKSLTFDSVLSGQRRVYHMNLEKLIHK